MALLTNTDLTKIIIDNIDSATENNLIIMPFERENLTPVGYDLRVGKNYVIDGNKKTLSDDNELKIGAKKMALIRTLEEIRMPKAKTLSALIYSKVSLSCKGLSNISTTVDADWKGNLLIAVHNNSNKAISLKHGEAFCTILFVKNESPAKEGKYAKPDGRSDILEDCFKKNSENNFFITAFVNLIPPLFSVFSLCIATTFFEDKPYLIAATVAVGVSISNYIARYIEPLLEFFRHKRKN